jgi:release factor glutamine methyltransferase
MVSAFPLSHVQSIVARLRAAGCVFAEDEARLLIAAAPTPDELTGLVDRRAAGVPLEHVLGWAEFCELRVAVDPGVFVPRRRTEFLVREAVTLARRTLRARPGTAIVVDLCCGSGALGAAFCAALAAAGDRIELHGADIDPAAVRCARRNVTAYGGRVYEGDLDRPLPAALRGRVDILMANAPYVPTADVALLPPEARVHEPRTALDGGADGLDILRRVIDMAPRWLAPGGHLLVESSERQAPRIAETMTAGGLSPRAASSAEWHATVLIGTRPAHP